MLVVSAARAVHVLDARRRSTERRTMSKVQRAEFWKAYCYLCRHRRRMDYPGYRRRGLPIGSGVTEAACKTVFTQRFKRSGMRRHGESGQVILDLRTIHRSGIWDQAFAADLAAREWPLAVTCRPFQEGSHGADNEVTLGFAA